jgi:hypothetical protein
MFVKLVVDTLTRGYDVHGHNKSVYYTVVM